MRITNNTGLPQALVDAVTNDPYEGGEADISVTRLIGSPRINQLSKIHADSLEADASTMLWSLMGQAVHSVLERAGEAEGRIIERRFFGEKNGMTISGQVDLIESTILSDYKFMSTWEIIYGLKPEKAAQLNVLRWLAEGEGVRIDTLQIVALLRDWVASKAKTDANYPQNHVHIIDVPVWSDERVEQYIADQVEAHAKANITLPECSEEDRWYTGDKYAVMKTGRKSALRLLNTLAEAEDWLGHNPGKGGTHIDYRPGENKRCNSYCPVKMFCEQYDNMLEKGLVA